MSALLISCALLHAAAAAGCLRLWMRGAGAGAALIGVGWGLAAALLAWAVFAGGDPLGRLAPLAPLTAALALATWRALAAARSREAGARAKADALEREQRRFVKEASSHLEASRARFRALAEAAPLGILEADPAGSCTYVSRRWCALTGGERKAALGNGWLAAVHPEDRALVEERWRDAVAAGRPGEVEFRPAGDAERWLYLQLVPREQDGELAPGYVGTLTEVTERRAAERERLRLEARVQHARKLESMGLLAGGVAHDFSNLAVSILGNVHVLNELARDDEELAPLLARVETAALRGAELARELLGYAGRGAAARELVDLGELVDEAAGLLEVTRPEQVELSVERAADPPALEGDPTQLRQLVLNLLSNAVEACAEKGGRVRARTGALQSEGLSVADTYTGEPLPAGGYVFLEVSDEGVGMDEETRRRMFDPFFTTRVHGRGLGLAVVLGVVRRLHGGLQVESAPGRGTTIRVLLPASDAPPVERESARRAVTR